MSFAFLVVLKAFLPTSNTRKASPAEVYFSKCATRKALRRSAGDWVREGNTASSMILLRNYESVGVSVFAAMAISAGARFHFQMIEPGDLPQPVLMVSRFAEQVGLSVTNIRLREALRNQPIRDPLIGLYNRRYREEMLQRETRQAVRAAQGLGVLMLDLDHFKKFNDTYGPDAGDTVLCETAALLLKSVRAEDIVCRSGGEPFLVILPVANLKLAQARAERIRLQIARVDGSASRPAAWNGHGIGRRGRTCAARHVSQRVDRGRRCRTLPRQEGRPGPGPGGRSCCASRAPAAYPTHLVIEPSGGPAGCWKRNATTGRAQSLTKGFRSGPFLRAPSWQGFQIELAPDNAGSSPGSRFV